MPRTTLDPTKGLSARPPEHPQLTLSTCSPNWGSISPTCSLLLQQLVLVLPKTIPERCIWEQTMTVSSCASPGSKDLSSFFESSHCHWRVYAYVSSVPSSPPLLVSTRNLSSSSVAVVWQPPLEANGEITEYALTLFGPGGSNTTHTSNTSFILTNLLPYTQYNVTITAATRKGSGPALLLMLHTDEGG